ncbi:MAG TPA: hypothetical protein VE262_22470 [Blastocatellia bacterium]|nr:hypothetical protein [Blastocatellia bacterium]
MSRYLAIVTATLLALTTCLAARPANAGGAEEDSNPIRLHATAMAGPIGSINSSGPVTINGRALRGSQSLWGGEVVQAPVDRSLRIGFEGVAQVTLGRGALARFSTGRAESHPVLVASVLSGDVKISLRQDAGAYVRASGSTFTASGGADFLVGVSEGEASLSTISGVVEAGAQAAQRRYKLRPVGLGSSVSVRARSTRQIQFQVTDENDDPVPDLPVLFLLGGGGGQSAGSLSAGAAAGSSVTATTNAQGLATASFTAGPDRATGTLTASVEGTNTSSSVQINVTTGGGFWSARNSLIVLGAVAAVGTTAAITLGGGDDGGLRPLPPPEVNP